ncbi:hypothetical protein ACFY12_34860 [Streptomyces sp. NPDC001339]|uniref:hypothetical protein n=1 Tax=Streptomyces sp. NPDC001339 TaxID=3364563 RepID=UPI0036A48DA5
MLDLLIGGLAVATAARVFVPDAARLARRGLAAGVMVGIASLTERGRSTPAPNPAGSEAIQACQEEWS